MLLIQLSCKVCDLHAPSKHSASEASDMFVMGHVVALKAVINRSAITVIVVLRSSTF